MEPKQTAAKNTDPIGGSPTGPAPVSKAIAGLHDQIRGRPGSVADKWAKEEQEVKEDRESTAQRAAWDKFAREVGSRYLACRFDSFELSEESGAEKRQLAALHGVAVYARDFDAEALGPNVILLGPSGTGKDHLLVAMAHAVWKGSGIAPKWQNVQTLFERCRDAIDDPSTRESEIINEFSKPQILYLSDPLIEGKLTPFQKSILFRVLDYRSRELRPTWISINATDRDDLISRMSLPLVRRMDDEALVVLCDWPPHAEPWKVVNEPDGAPDPSR